MDDKRNTWMFISVVALAIVSIIGWGRFNYSLATQGYLSEEFVINWVAARVLIIDGKSPYLPEVTREILTALDTAMAPAIERVPQFTSPIYSLLLFLPFAFIEDLYSAQAIWVTLQQIVLVVLILLTLSLSSNKPGRVVFTIFVITTFLGYHAIAPIYDGSTILMAGLFLLLSLLSIRSGREEMAGVWLGLTTIQLPYMLLPIILILIWTFTHRHRLVFLWFLGIMILLSVLGIFVISEWPVQYLRILIRYSMYVPLSSPGIAFRAWWPGIGSLMAWILTIVTGLVLLIEWWLAMKGEYRTLLWTVSLTLAIGFWIGLPASPQNLVILLLPLILCVSAWSERWKKVGSVIAVTSMSIVFVWEWWLVYLGLQSARYADSLRLLLPLPLICLVGLYWVRPVVVQPKRFLINRMRPNGNA